MDSKIAGLSRQTRAPSPEGPRAALASLPDELTIRIVKEAGLPPPDLIKLQSSSRQFRRVCRDNALWRELVVPRLPKPTGKTHMDEELPLYDDLCRIPKDAQAYLAKIWKSPNHAMTAKGAKNAVLLLPQNRQIVYMAVQKLGQVLQYAASDLKRDKVIILAAVKHDGRALLYAATELRHDKEVVLAAVKEAGFALQFATEGLKSNKDVVLEAIKQDPTTFTLASSELKRDSDIIRAREESEQAYG